MSNMMLQTIGRTVPATFVAMARQGIFFIPLVWLLSLSPLGLLGVQMAQSVSDLLTLAAAVPIQLYVLRQMSQMQPARFEPETGKSTLRPTAAGCFQVVLRSSHAGSSASTAAASASPSRMA